jgi:3-hydroxyacyl-CoA dehydrogenase/enoyl-CoA hydratase/3-hydroxybutyryl-CoA epimerase
VQWRTALHGDVEGPATNRALPKGAEEITNRLMLLMVNEAARCLEEKVVATAEDADFGMMMGTGFAPFRGGPLRFAIIWIKGRSWRRWMRSILAGPEKFAACDLLRQHAQNGTKFYQDNR